MSRHLAGWQKFRHNQIEDLKLTWSVWIPVFLLNFSFSASLVSLKELQELRGPMWLRVPVVAVVSFGRSDGL